MLGLLGGRGGEGGVDGALFDVPAHQICVYLACRSDSGSNVPHRRSEWREGEGRERRRGKEREARQGEARQTGLGREETGELGQS